MKFDIANLKETNMHSSRMLTACSLSYRGVFLQGVLCPGEGAFVCGWQKEKQGRSGQIEHVLRYFIAVSHHNKAVTIYSRPKSSLNQLTCSITDLVQSVPKPSKVRKDQGNRRLVESFVKSFSHAFCFFNRLLPIILRKWAGTRVCPVPGTGATGSGSGSRGPRGYL